MAEEFSREITRQAIARAALALDFREADEAVLDCLSDVIHHYIETIGEVTRDTAESSGRAYPGIQDAISSLESKKSITKTNWRELNVFAFGKSDQTSSSSSVWSQPFPFPVSAFPCPPQSHYTSSSQAPFSHNISSEQPPPSFVPSHFPPLPSAHNYKKSYPSGSSSSSSKQKRAAEGGADDAQQRAKRLHVAKNMQQSITALEDIVDKGKKETGVTAVSGSGSDNSSVSNSISNSSSTSNITTCTATVSVSSSAASSS